MAEKKPLLVYAAAYETVEAALADLDAIEQANKDEMVGQYDAAVIDKEDGKPHVVKRMDRLATAAGAVLVWCRGAQADPAVTDPAGHCWPRRTDDRRLRDARGSVQITGPGTCTSRIRPDRTI
jgi:hypothetical protein